MGDIWKKKDDCVRMFEQNLYRENKLRENERKDGAISVCVFGTYEHVFAVGVVASNAR